MKVKVLERFRDKFDHVTRYEVGSKHEFEDERAADLIERGLAEAVDETGESDENEDLDITDGKTEKVIDPDKTEKTPKTEEPLKTDESVKKEEPVKVEEPEKVEPAKTEKPSKAKPKAKAAEK